MGRRSFRYWLFDHGTRSSSRYVYRAIDQFGQVIDVFMSPQRDARAARQFFEQAIGTTKVAPVEVVTTKDRDAAVIVAGHAFVQNVRRGHYELATGEPANRRLAVAFDELVMAI